MENLRWTRFIICTGCRCEVPDTHTYPLYDIQAYAHPHPWRKRLYCWITAFLKSAAGIRHGLHTTKREKEWYIEKLEEWKGDNSGVQKVQVAGENDPDMMCVCNHAMNPETRRLIRLFSDDVEQTQSFSISFLGITCRVRLHQRTRPRVPGGVWWEAD